MEELVIRRRPTNYGLQSVNVDYVEVRTQTYLVQMGLAFHVEK